MRSLFTIVTLMNLSKSTQQIDLFIKLQQQRKKKTHINFRHSINVRPIVNCNANWQRVPPLTQNNTWRECYDTFDVRAVHKY